jgi:acyl-CoA thioesterase FadM
MDVRMDGIVFDVRGYECGPDMTAPPHVLLRWFEQLRWDSHREPDNPIAALFEAGHAAMVVAQRMSIAAPVSYGATLRGSIFVSRVGRTSMDITHELRRAHDDSGDGDLVARDVVTGVLVGPDRRPAPVPPAVRDRVVHDPSCTVDVTPVPESIDLGAPFARDIVVRASELDFLDHVNQANYLAYATDALAALGERRRVRGVALSYDAQAVLGDVLTVRAWARGDGFAVGITRGEQTLCRVQLGLE